MNILRILAAVIFIAITANCYAQMSIPKQYKIKITVGDEVISASLVDNATTRGFLRLFPITMGLKDYNNTEKIFDLPNKLSIAGAPSGIDPDVGDITYYAPWGNIAIFYEDFGYSSGLIKLGKIESSIEILKKPGPLKAKFELLDK